MVITRSLLQKPQKTKTKKNFSGPFQTACTEGHLSTIASSATGYCGKTLDPLKESRTLFLLPIDHFAVACLVAWPLSESEADVDLVVIETSLIFLC